PGVLEIERTPLSSRAAMVERVKAEIASATAPNGETRPSIYLRKQTQRFQNIAAGIALVVIIALVLIGRRTPSNSDDSPAASASSAPAPTPPPVASQRATAKIAQPRPTVRPAP